jgi:Copper type II ascorbate-dependent monooxygenase, C-terminal domain
MAAQVDARTHLRKPARGFQMRVGHYSIAPGEDLEMCEYRRLPIKKAMDVKSFTLRMPPGAHHFAMWGYGGSVTDDSRFRQGPFESVGCTGAAPDDPFPQLMIPTQSPNTTLRFPKGIALHLDPRQQVFLNPHMKNFGSEPFQPDIRFNFVRARKGRIEHYAEALTFGNMTSIHIPAGGDQTITAEWTTPMALTIIHLATHQHRLGTYANIELVSADGSTREKLVETYDWEHPSSVWPPGGIRLEKGRKLRVTCTWRNTTDRDVRFGPETTDEMCFAIGFFYRDAGVTPAAGSGCLPGKKGLLCPLAPAVSD